MFVIAYLSKKQEMLWKWKKIGHFPKIYDADYDKDFVAISTHIPYIGKVTKVCEKEYSAIFLSRIDLNQSSTLYDIQSILNKYTSDTIINCKYINPEDLIEKSILKYNNIHIRPYSIFKAKYMVFGCTFRIENTGFEEIKFIKTLSAKTMLTYEIKERLLKIATSFVNFNNFLHKNLEKVERYFDFRKFIFNQFSTIKPSPISTSNLFLFRKFIKLDKCREIKDFILDNRINNYNNELYEIDEIINITKKAVKTPIVIVDGVKFSVFDGHYQLANFSCQSFRSSLLIGYLISIDKFDTFMNKLRRLKLLYI